MLFYTAFAQGHSYEKPRGTRTSGLQVKSFTTEPHRTHERLLGQRAVKNHIQLLNHENICSLLVPFIGIKINKQALNFSSSYHDMYMVKNSG